MLSGDTVIDGGTCKKLFKQDANGPVPYNAALYEEGKKVYMITSHNVAGPTTYQPFVWLAEFLFPGKDAQATEQ